MYNRYNIFIYVTTLSFHQMQTRCVPIPIPDDCYVQLSKFIKFIVLTPGQLLRPTRVHLVTQSMFVAHSRTYMRAIRRYLCMYAWIYERRPSVSVDIWLSPVCTRAHTSWASRTQFIFEHASKQWRCWRSDMVRRIIACFIFPLLVLLCSTTPPLHPTVAYSVPSIWRECDVSHST